MLKEIISLILTVLSMAGLYGVFEKAGRDGWPAFIPGYDLWITYETFWERKYFYISAAEIILGGIILLLGMSACFGTALSWVCIIIGVLIMIAGFLVEYSLNKKISDAFGHNIAFAIGITILPWIFLPIIGFGKDCYIGG